jgi:hypothetical protein
MKKLLFVSVIFISSKTVLAQKVGIGTTTPVEKLHVVGNIKADTLKPAALKIATNAAAGKILTSDISGNAKWENAASTGSSKCFMNILLNSNTAGRMGFDLVSALQTDSVDLLTPKYNIGADFTINSSGTTGNKIIINNDGLYRIEAFVTFTVLGSLSGQNYFARLLMLTKESTGNIITEVSGPESLTQIDFSPATYNYQKGIKFTMDRYFNADSELTLSTRFENLSALNGVNVNNGYLSMYRIAD